MARARNIKPSFFTNDELADIEPLGRLFFIGLWTIADYQGNIEWRERRLKAQLLPYDNCDIKEIAINLDKSGFIRFYSDGDRILLNVVNFCTHQNPHKNEREKGSSIPVFSEEGRQLIDFKGLTINRDKSGVDRDIDGTDRADSLNLIPDSLNLIPVEAKPQAQLSSEGFMLKDGSIWICPDEYLNACYRQFGKSMTDREFESARFWLTSNPAKRKTAKGMTKFLGGWLDRAKTDLPAANESLSEISMRTL